MTEQAGAAHLLNSRYEVQKRLPGAPSSRSLIGQDRTTGKKVFVKRWSWRDVDDAQAARFHAEVAARRAARSPHLPNVVDAFQQAGRPELGYFLVEDWIDGKSLASRIDFGAPLGASAMSGLARSVLGALARLHRCTPLLTHHEVRPCNILQQSDGNVVLVGWNTQGPSAEQTPLGLPDYLPMDWTEPPGPASDLYGLGVSLVHAASLVEPGPEARNLAKAWDALPLDEVWRSFLERLIAPDAARRFSTASAALEALAVMERPKASVGMPSVEVTSRASGTGESASATAARGEPSTSAPKPAQASQAPTRDPSLDAEPTDAPTLDLRLPPVDKKLETWLSRTLESGFFRVLIEKARTAPALSAVCMIAAGSAGDLARMETTALTPNLLLLRDAGRAADVAQISEALVWEALEDTKCFQYSTRGRLEGIVTLDTVMGTSVDIQIHGNATDDEKSCLERQLGLLILPGRQRGHNAVQVRGAIIDGRVRR